MAPLSTLGHSIHIYSRKLGPKVYCSSKGLVSKSNFCINIDIGLLLRSSTWLATATLSDATANWSPLVTKNAIFRIYIQRQNGNVLNCRVFIGLFYQETSSILEESINDANILSDNCFFLLKKCKLKSDTNKHDYHRFQAFLQSLFLTGN